MNLSRTLAFLPLGAVLVLGSGCEQLARPVSGVNFLSATQESEVAATFADEVASTQRLLRDPEVEDYVSDLGQSLVGTLREPEFRYTFAVVEDDAINAFNIGGGYVFVHSGLLKEADTEGQVASVLAHEMGHQVKRHVAKAISRQQLFQVLAQVAVGANANQWLQLAANLGLTTGELYFGREAEREADSVMVELMLRAGYDPREALGLFGKLRALEKSEPGTVAKIFSSHPPTSERLAFVEAEIDKRSLPSDLIRDSRRFQQVKQRLR